MTFFDIMRNFLIFLSIAAACSGAAYLLFARQNGGGLTQTDRRFALGCLVYFGGLFLYYFLLLAIINISHIFFVRQFPTFPYREGLGWVVFIGTSVGLHLIRDKLLVRWVVYRKLRYIMHWHWGNKR